jgi:predicted metal-dependent hydrolase
MLRWPRNSRRVSECHWLAGEARVPCEVRRSARRRTLSIEVYPDLRVIVRAPSRCPRSLIEARLAERAPWIERQVERFRRLARERPPEPRYIEGETHLYMGEQHALEVVAAARAGVTRVTGALRLSLPPGSGADDARRALEAWYRARAGEEFAAVLDARFGPFRAGGHRRPELRVRAMRTRWGSLARAGADDERARMTVNLALIRAPLACIEYVIVHELCHLEYRGHGPRFRALLERHLPDWHERRRRLNALPLP